MDSPDSRSSSSNGTDNRSHSHQDNGLPDMDIDQVDSGDQFTRCPDEIIFHIMDFLTEKEVLLLFLFRLVVLPSSFFCLSFLLSCIVDHPLEELCLMLRIYMRWVIQGAVCSDFLFTSRWADQQRSASASITFSSRLRHGLKRFLSPPFSSLFLDSSSFFSSVLYSVTIIDSDRKLDSASDARSTRH